MNCSFWSYAVSTNFRGVYCIAGDERDWTAKIDNAALSDLSDILRCVAYCNTYYYDSC